MDTAATMHCWCVPDDGADGRLVMVERPLPRPKASQVLIAVEAAGVNKADLYQAEGRYPLPKGANPVPGLEVAGRVVDVGHARLQHLLGRRVACITDGGGMAAYAVADGGLLFHLPDSMSFTEAAALPEGLMTGWMAMFYGARLKAGESLLLYGAAGGIGPIMAAMALAHGVRVIGTASSEARCQAMRARGLTMINHQEVKDLAIAVKELTEGHGVDVVVDSVGGERAADNLRMLAYGGRMITLALQGGQQASIPLGSLFVKQLTWRGMLLRPQSIQQKRRWFKHVQEKYWPNGQNPVIELLVDRVLPMAELGLALAELKHGHNLGKLVMKGAPAP